MAEEQLRKLKLFVVQPHFLESGFQQILTTVQCDISEAERKRSVGVAATGEGADTGKKFVCGKGLGQVIVRPGIQSDYPVGHLRLGGQEQGRCGVSLCAGGL